ncbi:g12594 [Coccomyxa viridis]|uniref:G12594 protein n=1 Tax=Coccomyxa viridis TaxID=1274662 RepID=A0ABP1GAQ3_9CHLO
MAVAVQQAFPEDAGAQGAKPLEAFVRERIVSFSGESAFARRLNLAPSVVRNAAIAALTELALRGSELNSAADCGLIFRHDCLSLGCLDFHCELCRQTPHRRCRTTFAGKYLSGDTLKAKCGAPIRMEVVDKRTGDPIPGHLVRDMRIEVCILDCKAYEELMEAGETEAFANIDNCVILTGNQGKGLLHPGPGEEVSDDKKIQIQLAEGEAILQCSILGSSIALLSGQKPAFRLLARAISLANGQPVPHIKPAVSEAFVVATPRVKSAQKPDIPHIDEHVSKVECIGVKTQQKLLDIKAAAATVGIQDLNVIHNTITTVGQFKELVLSAERDQPLQEHLRKVLNLTAKGWEEASRHALRAVTTDNRMRMWLADDAASTGLLFRCARGRIALDTPVGLLQKVGVEGQNEVRMEATPVASLQTLEKQFMAQLQHKATETWNYPGHPGWSIWGMDSEAFLQDWKERPERVHIVAPMPTTTHALSSNMLYQPQPQGLLAQPAPLSLFPNGFQAALMDAQAQAQGQPPQQQQQPPPLPESSVPLQAPGAHVDNTQMLPSPFDNVHGGANAVSHVPSSMQQSSAEGDTKASEASLPGAQPVQSVFGLMDSGEGPQLPGMLSKLSGLFSTLQGSMVPAGLGPTGFPGQPAGPEAANGLPGQDPSMAPLNGAGQSDGQDPAWRFSDMMQYGSMAPWRDMDAGKRTMMQRMSGRVSGLLDDLSDAISLLNDIMPSKASEQMFAAAAQAQGGSADPAAPPIQLQLQQQQQQQAPAAAPQMPSPAYNGIAEQGLPPRKRKAPGRD